MPELPEVEIIRGQMEEELRGARIEDVKVLLPRLIRHPSTRGYRRGLKGKAVLGVRRRGKYLLLEMEGGRELVFHLGMTGSFVFSLPGADRPRHTHLVFRLSDGRELLYVDPRTFGETALVPAGDYRSLPGLQSMGPEPVGPDFNCDRLREALRGKCRLKAALLDQSRLAGIGNIYADESLYRAGINPLRRLDELTGEEVARLHRAIREVLDEAIRGGGSSVSDYVDLHGERGNFQERHRVYRRAGQPCARCGDTIRRARVAGRSTYFCPRCQT